MIKEAYEHGQRDAEAELEKLGFLGTEAAKGSADARARSHGILAGQAAKARKESPGQYLLNPSVSGPLTEGLNRLGRRANASAKTDPWKTALIPGYGMIAGGKAGKKELTEKLKGKY